jgi:hypothetical protein
MAHPRSRETLRSTTRTGLVLVAALVTFVLALSALPESVPAAEARSASCLGLRATIRGSDRSEVIRGTAANDVIVAGGGHDVVRGEGGADIICAGDGRDQVLGGNGADRVFGGSGDDTLRGGDGNDALEGGQGDDQVSGGQGNDNLDGGPGNDALDAGEGTDTCAGGEGLLGCEGSSAPSPSPSPSTGSGGGPGTLGGTWVLIQVQSAPSLSAQSDWISDALTDFDVRGLSVRVPWRSLNTSILDTGKALADAAGRAYSIRFMAGRHTPEAVFSAGSPYYVVGGEKVPTPFNANGSPNTVFESFFEAQVAELASYCRSNGIHLLHLPWYGQDWAELNNGAEVRNQPGYSEAAFIQAHERLIDIALRYAGDDLAVEFPMSGYGPLDRVGAALTQHIVDVAGASSPRIYVQANGLSPNGDWGAPNATVEGQMDAAVWSKPVLRGEQMIQPGDYNWAAVYDQVSGNSATYVEVYIESFRGNRAAELAAEISAFA